MQTTDFPNCFFLGFTHTAVTVNVPQALNEQAMHRLFIERLWHVDRYRSVGEPKEETVREISSLHAVKGSWPISPFVT